MGEKTKVRVITDTILLDGIYQTEQRSGKDRRRSHCGKWRFYERRRGFDPRFIPMKKIDEEV
nr:hypothetical protein [Vibrio hepatarius]